MIKDMLRNSALNANYITPIRSFFQWKKRQYADNAPQLIKDSVLLRNGLENAIWVETGTYLGTTTRFLERHAREVYTIEPEPKLFKDAEEKFSKSKKVTVINGVSENVFPQLLPTLKGDMNFWLDGHYSAGITFQGEHDCPVEYELEEIKKNLQNFSRVSVLIDDVRCFLPENEAYANYPSIDLLVDWARENHFFWHIEHDIFVAKNYKKG